MTTYSSSETVIPSLSFTKAELAYLLFVLMKDIPFTNTSNKIELVEVRHYLNQIGEKVLLSTHDGSLKEAIREAIAEPKQEAEEKKMAVEQPPTPNIQDLKAQFPTLSEEEIKEILASAKEERKKKEAEQAQKNALPPRPSFLVKQQDGNSTPSTPSQSHETASLSPSKADRDKETSKKFATLLGAF